MRAAWYSSNGPADAVLTLGEIATPEAGPGEVRVRLHASGVNPSDVKSRAMRPLAGPQVVPHSDGAGVIDQVGAGVAPQRLGQRVWVWNGQWLRALGTAAEFIVLPEVQAVPLPDAVSFAEGACLGIPVLTAFQAVHLAGDIAGKTVLVTGAGSVVGHYVTQIAQQAGATVIGTVGSAEKAQHALAAGAAATIDYKRENVAERVLALTGGHGAAAIIDMDLSGTAPLLAAGVLAPHGSIVCYGSNTLDAVPLPFLPALLASLTLRFFLVYELTAEDRARAIAGVNALLAAGRLTHTIGLRLPFGEIVAAHQAVEAGIAGKVVLELP